MSEALGIGWAQIAGVLAAFLAGGTIKGGLGFGLPLVTLSTLPLFVPVDLALVMNALTLPVLNAWQIRLAGALSETLARFWPLVAALVVTLPMGVGLATSVAPESLLAALGIAIMVFATINLINPRIRIPQRLEAAAAVAAGTGAGIVGGITTINGPFFLTFLLAVGAERRLMLSALGVFFLVTGVLLSLSFALVGLIDLPRLLLAAACLVPGALGMAAGDRLARLLPLGAFRLIVLGILFLLGVNIFLSGLGA